MINTKFVFVILIYRNYEDLLECLESIKEKISSYQVIVINAFYDEESKNAIEKIAKENNCHFLNIENKGYSYGNNAGIKYANENIDYQYLIVSNPDIIIKDFDENKLDECTKFSIIAPKIVAKNGKRQNPISFRRNKLKEKLEYVGLTKNNKFLFYTAIMIGKFNRYLSLLFHLNGKKPFKIYGAHGSFVIFRKSAIDILSPVYDENMFLFGEEGVLALRAKENHLVTGQLNCINIFHKEDGSMKLADFSINKELVKSNIYYYEHYVMKPKKKDKID